jgi:homoserine O-acetyltransferase
MLHPDPTAQALFDLRLPPLPLEGGGTVVGHRLRGWLWGGSDDVARLVEGGMRLDGPTSGPPGRVARTEGTLAGTPSSTRLALGDDRPTVLLIHALTGDMRAGGEGGWWEPLIGIDRPLDPRRMRIVCFNNLGGCYGSSGPGDADYPRGEAGRPVPVTSWDQARSLWMGLDSLGVRRLHAVVGGSLGGMIALAMAALEPKRVERVVPIAACEAASAWIIGWNHVARQLVSLDAGGRGLELARQLAMMTYRAEAGLQQRHGRRTADDDAWTADGAWRIGSYLEHQGVQLRARFDPEAYLLQLGAMDSHDLARRPSHLALSHDGEAGDSPGDPGGDSSAEDWGVGRIRASAFVVGIDTDALYLPAQSWRLADRLARRGNRVERATLASPHGHDAFLIEWPQLTHLLACALALPPGD